MDYERHYEQYRAAVEDYLSALFAGSAPYDRLYDAMRYSVLSGGKRIRPVLTLEFARLGGIDWHLALPYACALELVHNYSLIHDDLPCMDDAATRRGQPSCHKKFGEATALLAADALLTEAFEVIAASGAQNAQAAAAVACLARAAGGRGMVYGQELDLKYEALAATEEQLRLIHRHKTGALINAAIQMGAAAAQATEQQSKELEDYAYGIGLVFQIVDDVLDVVGSQEQLGKPIGSDSENGKTTFVTLFGTDGAMELAKKLNNETCASLHREFGEKSAFLVELARELLVRRS